MSEGGLDGWKQAGRQGEKEGGRGREGWVGRKVERGDGGSERENEGGRWRGLEVQRQGRREEEMDRVTMGAEQRVSEDTRCSRVNTASYSTTRDSRCET